MKQGCIAFFDSGIGGLTLMRECCRALEGERLLYFGDNGNAPYGNRSAEKIEELAFGAFGCLARFPVKAAVIACNTVTAECADALRRRFSFPVLGVEPALKPAAKQCENVLVLATKATLSSRRFSELAEKVSRGCRFTFHSPPALAEDIENNIFDLSRVDLSRHLPEGSFDGAVLGCTHYVFMKKEIGSRYGCAVFDGNAGTAKHLAKVLAQTKERERFFFTRNPFGCSEPKGEAVCVYSEEDEKYHTNTVCFAGSFSEKNRRVFCDLLK